jgi:acetyl esterase/lipase
MPLDPQMKTILDQMAAAKAPAFYQSTPTAARAQMARQTAKGEPAAVAHVENRAIAGPGGDLPVRIYTPLGGAPIGALVYFHGGGWVVGSLDMVDQPCRILANASRCVTVSVDYRLAPEHKFPAAPEDCYAAVKWTLANATALGCAAPRVAVAGSSAGGTLAAVAALMARDRGGPRIDYQLLIYPATRRELDTPSQLEFAEGNYYVLSRADMEWFWGHYLADAADANNPYACPARAATLKGLPPAMVMTAEFDPLRDEGEDYATRLKADSVPTVLKRYEGVTHGFFGMPSILEKSRVAIADAGSALRTAFAS